MKASKQEKERQCTHLLLQEWQHGMVTAPAHLLKALLPACSVPLELSSRVRLGWGQPMHWRRVRAGSPPPNPTTQFPPHRTGHHCSLQVLVNASFLTPQPGMAHCPPPRPTPLERDPGFNSPQLLQFECVICFLLYSVFQNGGTGMTGIIVQTCNQMVNKSG